MRFAYDPSTRELSLYVKKHEFDLAVNDEEYRVFRRDFSENKMATFIEEFSAFVRKILCTIYTEEKVQDILAISSSKKGYTWTSLMHLEYSENAVNFLENLMSYGLHIVQHQSEHGKDSFIQDLNSEDMTKLNLIVSLISTLNYPQPWQKRAAGKNQLKLKTRITRLAKQIKALEQKYGFSSDEMLKYYADDELPDARPGAGC